MTGCLEELGIADDLVQAARAIGIRQPTQVQQRVVPAIIAQPRRDIILTAPSKTGRTVALVLGILQSINRTEHAVQAALLVPHRELVRETLRLVQSLAAPLPVVSHGMGLSLPYGEIGLGNDAKVIRENGVQVVVSTPRQLAALMAREASSMSGVTMVVVDGVDEILSRNDGEHVEAIKESLCFAHIQFVLVSISWSPEVRQLADRAGRDPVSIAVPR